MPEVSGKDASITAAVLCSTRSNVEHRGTYLDLCSWVGNSYHVSCGTQCIGLGSDPVLVGLHNIDARMSECTEMTAPIVGW